jgi:beta-lactamase superfamily II metal-dependent hydrolase
MPFWDLPLDVVILTHPESDHVTGLVGVLERLEGLPVYRTDEHGAGEMISDGARVWVEGRRNTSP